MDPVKRRIRMQVRATPAAGDGTFSAVVSTYQLEYDVGWGWTEQIMPGCFAESIKTHAAIPIFYNHQWDHAPIGSGTAAEDGNQLVVTGGLYLGAGDMVTRVYQAMVDGALEEWSIGFWPEEMAWEQSNPNCDQIIRGDLAEASICIRGANPETGTLELNARSQPVYLMGGEDVRRREVSRLRARFDPSARADGHTHVHTHDDGTTHSHDHTHSGGNYDHGQDASDPDNEVAHAHSHPDNDPEPPPSAEDPGMDESSRARVERAFGSPHWAADLAALRDRTRGDA